MGRITRHDQEFRDEVAGQLRKVIRRKRGDPGISQVEAAKLLGVSRQAVNQYLAEGGTITPRTHVLAKAVKLWDLKLTIDGFEFGAQAFADTESSTSERRPVQRRLRFFDESTEFGDSAGRINVRVGPGSENTLEVRVELKLVS